MYKTVICIFFCLVLSVFSEGEEMYVIDTLRIDTGLVQIRNIDANFYETYKADKDFNYDRTIEQQSETFLQRILRNIMRWLSRQLGKASNYYESLSIVFKLLFWLLLAGFFVFIISKLNINRLFYSEKDNIPKAYVVGNTEEDIEDIEAAITEEVRQKNFRKAIRYHFIDVLRQLNHNKIITLSDSKTNYDYLKETRKSNLSDIFIRLIHIYNAVWYGHYDIDETDYAKLQNEFINFKTTVHEKK